MPTKVAKDGKSGVIRGDDLPDPGTITCSQAGRPALAELTWHETGVYRQFQPLQQFADLPLLNTMSSTSREDAYYRDLYVKDADFRQLALQDADFRTM